MGNEGFTGVWRLRETQGLVKWLRGRNTRLVTIPDLNEWVTKQTANPWTELLQEAIAEYEGETEDATTMVDAFIEWLAEWAREMRRRQRGLLLTTAHGAKGLEFDHVAVLDGGWDRPGQSEDVDTQRRLYYVAMTRARQTLMLGRFQGGRFSGPHPIQDALGGKPSVLYRSPSRIPSASKELARQHKSFNLKDVFLSFAGYHAPGHHVHNAIAGLGPGDALHVRVEANRWELMDQYGTVVGRVADRFQAPRGMRCASAAVLAIATWDRESSEPAYRTGLRCDSWEVVVPELVFEPICSNQTSMEEGTDE